MLWAELQDCVLTLFILSLPFHCIQKGLSTMRTWLALKPHEIEDSTAGVLERILQTETGILIGEIFMEKMSNSVGRRLRNSCSCGAVPIIYSAQEEKILRLSA